MGKAVLEAGGTGSSGIKKSEKSCLFSKEPDSPRKWIKLFMSYLAGAALDWNVRTYSTSFWI